MSLNLNDFIRASEMPIRLGFFFGIFAVMALWELVRPRRHLRTSNAIRWSNNLGLVFFNSFVLRLVPGMLAIPFIGKVQDYAINHRQWGDDHEQ